MVPHSCAERALRSLVLGRKAWLFAGSDREPWTVAGWSVMRYPRDADLEIDHAFGDFDGGILVDSSPEIVIVARAR